jgi:HAD superfamily hydrolase (TIGR01509 family)
VASASTEAAPWAVIFDVDGTMVDNRLFHRDAWIEFGHRNGFPITAEYYSQKIHSRSNEANARLLYGDDVDSRQVACVDEEKEAIYRELFGPHLREMPGLTELLQELCDAGVPCATVSNSPHSNIGFVLDGLEIRAYFDVILSVSDVPLGKPHPDLYEAAARGLNVPVRRCVVIEDSPSGFAAAEAAGAPYVVITAGADPEHLHKAAGAAAQHPDFSTLTLAKLAALVG